MTLFRRGSIWWFKFLRKGIEVRESARTKNRNIALDRERARKNAVDGGASLDRAPKPSSLPIAARAWIDANAGDWERKTLVSSELSVRHLGEFFGVVTIENITADDIARYKTTRRKEGASPRTINIELGSLRAILRKHRLWERIAPDVKFMKAKSDVGRALSDEEVRLLIAASRESRSRSLYPALLVSLHTGLRNSELRSLRWYDIDLERSLLTVSRSKTEGGRGRHIPLSAACYDALPEWRSNFPELRPSHFVFATERVGLDGEAGYLTGAATSTAVDPTKAIGSWRTAFNAAKKRAGVECRWHDLRHTFVSQVGESGVSEQTLVALAGWMSRRMLRSTVTHGWKQSAEPSQCWTPTV